MGLLDHKLVRTSIIALSLATALSCSDDTTEIPEELRGDPYCLYVTGSWGYFEDGSQLLIGNWNAGVVVGGCVCATEDEIRSGVREDEMHDRALEQCELYASMQDFVSDECVEDYESGSWLGLVMNCKPGSGCENVPPPELHCAGE